MKKIAICLCALFVLGNTNNIKAYAIDFITGNISSASGLHTTLSKTSGMSYTGYAPKVIGAKDYLVLTNVLQGVGTSIHGTVTILEGDYSEGRHNASYATGTKMYINCQPRDFNFSFPIDVKITH